MGWRALLQSLDMLWLRAAMPVTSVMGCFGIAAWITYSAQASASLAPSSRGAGLGLLHIPSRARSSAVAAAELADSSSREKGTAQTRRFSEGHHGLERPAVKVCKAQ